jgi:REP element-mobilizing transposase RayT
MARINRFDYIHDGCIVHVRLQVNNREFLFHKAIFYRLWRRWVGVYLLKYPGIKLTGYQWMSNHCHLIIETETGTDLPKFLHDINWRFAFEYNKKTKRSGHFFQSRYRCSVIDKDEYEMICQRYIYRNQFRAGMVKHVKQSRYSSYQHYAYGRMNPLITPFRNYFNFGSDPHLRMRHFRIFVETMTDQEESLWKEKLKHHGLKTKKQTMKNIFQLINQKR